MASIQGITEGMRLLGQLPDGTLVFRPQSTSSTASPTILPLSQTREYKYLPLEEGCIRLLTIHPRSLNGPGTPNDDELLCSLTSIDLSENTCPAYEAISYAWSQSNLQTDSRVRFANATATPAENGGWIHLRPVFANESLTVTGNVETILRRLRRQEDHEQAFRTIWIDQICINQQTIASGSVDEELANSLSSKEKDGQIAKMAEIYARATRVIIWLGDEVQGEDMPKAFECIKRLANMKQWLWQDPFTAKFPGPNMSAEPWNLEQDHEDFVPLEEWKALRHMLNSRIWFRRAWILQEAVMAHTSTVLCGADLEISWDIVELACQVIYSMDIYKGPYLGPEDDPTFAISNVHSICALRAAVHGRSDPLGLRIIERLLMDTRPLEATNPQDIIYSKMGLASNSRPLPTPHTEASVREVYIRMATYWLFDWKANIDMLNEVQVSRRDHELPSWVPDWSIPRVAIVFAAARYEGGFDATDHDMGTFRQHIAVVLPEIPPDHMTIPKGIAMKLKVRGIALMAVMMVQPVNGTRGNILVPNLEFYPTTGQSYPQVCGQILKSNSQQEWVRRPPQTRQFWAYKREFESRPKRTDGKLDFQILRDTNTRPEEDDLRIGGFFEPASSTTARNLFISECGFMGLVPAFTVADKIANEENMAENSKRKYTFSEGAASGDLIALLFGARTPFVLRKLESGNWRLLGECYVHGLMFGEAVRGMDESLIEDFVLE
jgi:hypothetical protein